MSAPTSLHPEHTFERFLVGASNGVSHSAALSVATRPGRTYNPLFIHGATGLGKTHLLTAIAHRLRAGFPGRAVVFATAENVLDGLDADGCDALLVDDAQFLRKCGDRTQDELFGVFDAMRRAKKQVVVAADVPPEQMLALDARLRKGFDWGLAVDVQPPERPLQVRIVRQRAAELGTRVEGDVAEAIAASVPNGVRPLLGALNAVLAHHRVSGAALTAVFAADILRGYGRHPARQPGVDAIQREAAKAFGLTVAQLTSAARQAKPALARQVAMYLCRQHTPFSLPEVGRRFGGRDHTTVLHAERKIARLLAHDAELRAAVAGIEGRLRAL